jgi:hypothetical protein
VSLLADAVRFEIPKPADRDEWLRLRHRDPATGLKWFNASDAGTVMGVSPFQTLADLAVRYLTDEPGPDDPTEAMDRGHRCEPMILAWYGDQHGVEVVTPDVMYGHGRLLATIDGVPIGVPDLGVEAKSTADYWQEPPESVFWQCVAQTICTGWRAIDVPWLDASMRFKCHRFVPTDADREALLGRVDEVLAFIDMGMVPEGAHLTAKHVSSLHPVAEPGLTVEVTDVELAAIADWEEARQARLAAEKAEDAAKAQVLSLLGDAADARWKDTPVVTWKNNKPGERIDWSALEADHPDLVDVYRKIVPGARVLRATKALAKFVGERTDSHPVDEPADDTEVAT